MQPSRLPLRKWVFAMYLMTASLKGVPSMKLHLDLKITRKTAWYLAQRIRQPWDEAGIPMPGPRRGRPNGTVHSTTFELVVAL